MPRSFLVCLLRLHCFQRSSKVREVRLDCHGLSLSILHIDAKRKACLVRNKQRAADASSDAEGSLPSAEFSLPPAKEFNVPYLPDAPGVAKDKEIHPRRAAPPVPEAPAAPDRSEGQRSSPPDE
jgi:hypothetical protein